MSNTEKQIRSILRRVSAVPTGRDVRITRGVRLCGQCSGSDHGSAYCPSFPCACCGGNTHRQDKCPKLRCLFCNRQYKTKANRRNHKCPRLKDN